MKILNLGAGNSIVSGAVNHDLVKHREEIDVTHDLNERPWPWSDESFDVVIAHSVFEHLRITLVEALDECWRILRPGAELFIKLPMWNSETSYRDPTHVWHLSPGALDYFDPDRKAGRAYHWYTPRKWEIVKGPWLNNAETSFLARMRVRK